MPIRTVTPSDTTDWERLRQALWPSPAGEHAREVAKFFTSARTHPHEVLLAFDDGGRAIGFAEMAIRQHVAGCEVGRVAYLEGWYVEPAHRGTGVGRALVKAVEHWGRAQGCTELGSDTELHNTDSIAAHGALRFEEVERVVCFRKSL
jgi:aminoglycoside 6'-N-acetyltransferase I